MRQARQAATSPSRCVPEAPASINSRCQSSCIEQRPDHVRVVCLTPSWRPSSDAYGVLAEVAAVRATPGRAARRAPSRAARRATMSAIGTREALLGPVEDLRRAARPRSASRRIHFFSHPRHLQLGGDRGRELHQLVVEERRARLERVRHRRDVHLRRSGRPAGRSLMSTSSMRSSGSRAGGASQASAMTSRRGATGLVEQRQVLVRVQRARGPAPSRSAHVARVALGGVERAASRRAGAPG